MSEAEAINGVSLDVPGLVNVEREEAGDWFGHDQVDGLENVLLDKNNNGLKRVFVRSRYTSEYQTAEAAFEQTLLRVPPDEREERRRQRRYELMAEHCLKDWEFTDRKGEQIKCTPELAKLVMTEPAYRNHRNFITAAIMVLQGDIQTIQGEDEKN